MEAAALAATANPFTSRLRLQSKPLKSRSYTLPLSLSFSQKRSQQLFVKCSLNEPYEKPPANLMRFETHVTDRLLQSLPESVKEFPWMKAEEIVLQRFFTLLKRALRWTLLVLFVLGSISDIILSISRNRELLIPLGLFLGCAMADFLKETSQELFQTTEVGDLLGHLVGIGSFFVLLKFVSLYLPIGGRLFFSHISNGAIMQVLWLGKKLQEAKDSESEK